jgi:hypothetical protein
MPGPPPKDPAVRQRRNKTSTTAQLPSESACRRRRVPPLPERWVHEYDKDRVVTGKKLLPWPDDLVAWWTDLWRSPQATQWTRAMYHELVMLATLRERWQLTGESKDAAEYRMHRRDFGLTTLDMRRLQWSIEEEGAPKKRAAARVDAAAQDAPDPRGVLRAVK